MYWVEDISNNSEYGITVCKFLPNIMTKLCFIIDYISNFKFCVSSFVKFSDLHADMQRQSNDIITLNAFLIRNTTDKMPQETVPIRT
jgi:hypothetical protein